MAAPLALGTAAAASGLFVMRWYVGLVASPAPLLVQLKAGLDGWNVLLGCAVAIVVAAAAALAGAWRRGRWCAAAGSLGFAAAAVISGPAFGDPVFTPAMMAITALVMAACPPDRRDEAAAGAAVAVVAAVLVPLTALYARALPGISTDYGSWPLLVLIAAGVILAVRNRSVGARELGATAVASPPFVAYAYTSAGDHLLPAVLAAVLPVGALLAALAVHLRRQVGSAR
ncbi:hypothetical protein GEV43_33490 [Actinomadura sp. J1-007]|uniref:hypothetical protein n=1 Tax=Actinomadura sp. J1-007 TaxID=2661913 RepID=UPI00132A0083|nr:hypothetical protein [Actinomadura sp. J1-007]MWK38469.1 hypothetical protein [Actinomadura sp. J1-007]